MIAEQAGSGERQSARMSHACGAPTASFANGRAGSNLTHQPSCTNSKAEQTFQTTSTTMHARARAVRRNSGQANQRAGKTPAMSTASASRSSGTPSNGPLMRSGQSSAPAAKSPHSHVMRRVSRWRVSYLYCGSNTWGTSVQLSNPAAREARTSALRTGRFAGRRARGAQRKISLGRACFDVASFNSE